MASNKKLIIYLGFVAFIIMLITVFHMYQVITINRNKVMILNLARSTDRRSGMERQLARFHITNYAFVPAVDGQTDLSAYQYRILSGWIDPVQRREMNKGEIGCSLSHYSIWKYVVDNNLPNVLILEDDATFQPRFTTLYSHIISTCGNDQYDLLYISRKPLNELYELGPERDYNDLLLVAKYSYNADGYLLTNHGAQKLLNADFLNNLIPVDEFLPIMYDSNYPFKEYADPFKQYPKLVALALKENISSQNNQVYATTIGGYNKNKN
jgi:collagen beta-1,O-galactosyltransferase